VRGPSVSADSSAARGELAAHWALDPQVRYLNHGSFGACPRAVLEAQAALRREMEREPVDFLVGALPARLAAARQALARFLGAKDSDLVFVPNATTGVNAVLRSLEWRAGDELLLTNHTYPACRKAAEYITGRSGARVVIAELPFPLCDPQHAAEAVLEACSPHTRLALLDHVTSPSALVLPVETLVRTLESTGIQTLIDGAHAPGMVPLDLDSLGASYYTGNAHKWLCAPKGAGFLHVRRDRQEAIHPTVISHGYPSGMQAEFDWPGTFDPTAWLSIPDALEFLGCLLPGGWPELMARNHALALAGRTRIAQILDIEPPCSDSMIGAMASLRLPAPAPGSIAATLDEKGLHDWLRAQDVEGALFAEPLPLLRISAQLYNRLEDYEHLARLLRRALLHVR